MRRPKGPRKRERYAIVRKLPTSRWVIWYDPWRGPSLPVCTPLCAYCGCEECQRAVMEVEEMKRPTVKTQSDESSLARVDVPKLLKALPNAAELIIQPGWEDGGAKGDRAVLVFVSTTMVRIIAKVASPPLKLVAAGRTWDDAWAALDLILRGEDIPWEDDSLAQQPRGKKRS